MAEQTAENPQRVRKIKKISGNIVDVLNNKIYAGTIEIKNGKIFKITPEEKEYKTYIMPGFIDSHIHIESSMLIPSEFARSAVTKGMVSVVADPHEISNVLGTKGIDFMIENGNKVPFKFYFGAPSCVPATPFESTGAKIPSSEIAKLMERKEIKYLGEMMNFFGVIKNDKEVLAKIDSALKNGKPIDGHAPGLVGENLKKYIGAGISTDHEAYSKVEGLEKIKMGMKILIREGDRKSTRLNSSH